MRLNANRPDRRNAPVVTRDPNLIETLHQMPQQIRLIDGRDNVDAAMRNRVVTRDEAFRLRDDTGLDLYVVNADVQPIVMKLLDYSKFKYEQQKHEREVAKKQRENTRTVKEFNFNATTGDHDVQVKIGHIKALIPDHDIKIAVKLVYANKAVLTNRFSRPLGVAIHEEDFVLNRVIRELEPLIRPTKVEVGDKIITAMLRLK